MGTGTNARVPQTMTKKSGKSPEEDVTRTHPSGATFDFQPCRTANKTLEIRHSKDIAILRRFFLLDLNIVHLVWVYPQLHLIGKKEKLV